MAEKAINTSDLQNLKNEIKLEIGEEQRKIRHDKDGKIQLDYFKIDEKVNEYKSDLRLTNATMQRMQDDLTEIKELLTDFMKIIPSTYVSKDELLPIKEKQKSHDDTIAWVVRGIVVGFISLIAGLVGLSKYM